MLACGRQRPAVWPAQRGGTGGVYRRRVGHAGGFDLCDGLAQWIPIASVVQPAAYAPPSLAPPPYSPTPAAPADSNRVLAGVCALLFGGFGVHKFILGYHAAGLIMLLTTVLSCGLGWFVMHAIGFIEGIIYLTRSDSQFYQEYVVNRKTWF